MSQLLIHWYVVCPVWSVVTASWLAKIRAFLKLLSFPWFEVRCMRCFLFFSNYTFWRKQNTPRTLMDKWKIFVRSITDLMTYSNRIKTLLGYCTWSSNYLFHNDFRLKSTYSNWWTPISFPYRSLETVHKNTLLSLPQAVSVLRYKYRWQNTEQSKPLESSPTARALLRVQWTLWGSLCAEALTGPFLDHQCWQLPAILDRNMGVCKLLKVMVFVPSVPKM